VHDQLSVTNALLQHGACPEKVNGVGDTALHLAAANNSLGVLERLLAAPRPPLETKSLAGSTALHKAAAYGNRGACRLLIQAGAYLDCVDNAQTTPMHDAATNAYGVTPLHAAALRGHADCVRLLLTSGANANAKDGRELTPAAVARSSDQVFTSAFSPFYFLTHDSPPSSFPSHFATCGGARHGPAAGGARAAPVEEQGRGGDRGLGR